MPDDQTASPDILHTTVTMEATKQRTRISPALETVMGFIDLLERNPSFELKLLVNALSGDMSVESEKNFLEGFIDKCNMVLGSGNKEYQARLGSFVDKLTGENMEKLELKIKKTQILFEKDKQRLLEFLG